MRRFTRAAAFNALIVFVIGPMQSATIVLLSNVMQQYALMVGQYVAPLSFSTSTLCFISYMVFMRNFRRELMSMLGCCSQQVTTAPTSNNQ